MGKLQVTIVSRTFGREALTEANVQVGSDRRDRHTDVLDGTDVNSRQGKTPGKNHLPSYGLFKAKVCYVRSGRAAHMRTSPHQAEV